MAFSRRVVYLTAFPWRLQGVVTAFMALAWRFYCVLWRSYDKSTEKDEQKDMQILSQKQTNHYLNGMHIHEFFHKFLSICLSSSKLVYYLCVMQVQQFQIAADATRLVLQRRRRRRAQRRRMLWARPWLETLFLFCLQAVRAVLKRRGSAVRTPWKRGVNAKSAAQTQ